MKFELPKLPYEIDALEPHLTAKTLEFHYDRHHRGYVEKLRSLIEGTPQEKIDLPDLVACASGEIFNNAAQVWNHTFYWNSMTPNGGGEPPGQIGQAIARSFGSFATFQKEFIASAAGLFGSGYVWLTFEPEQERLTIEPMKDAENPLRVGRIPLLVTDVWEHAYYLDYQNARQHYVEAFLLHLANWRFAEANLESCNSNGAP